MAKYDNMKDVAEAVQESGDLLVTSLGELREALDYNRLGVRVLQEIGRKLEGEGLGYFPEWVIDENSNPRYGDEVRVYKRGTPIGDIVDAVLRPSNAGDERLRQEAGGDASELLNRIRALVTE